MLIMTLKIIFVVVMVVGAYLFFSDIIHSMFHKKPTEEALLEKETVPAVSDENADVDTEETEDDDANDKDVKNLKTIAQNKQNKETTEEIENNSDTEKPELQSSLFATEFDEEVKKSLQKDMEVLSGVDNQFDTESLSTEKEIISEEQEENFDDEESEKEKVSSGETTFTPRYTNPLEVGSSQTELHYSSGYAVPKVTTSIKKIEPHSPLLEQSINENHNPEQDSPLTNASDNLNIVILPSDDTRMIRGEKLLQLIDDFGFKFGTMNMLHRYQNKDGSGILWFSMMGLTKEGVITFDLNTLPTIDDLKGLVMFLPLPHPNVLQGFDSMMSISGLICREIDGYIIDEYGDEITTEYKKELRNLLQATLIEDE